MHTIEPTQSTCVTPAPDLRSNLDSQALRGLRWAQAPVWFIGLDVYGSSQGRECTFRNAFRERGMWVHGLFHFFDGRLEVATHDELGNEFGRMWPNNVGT